MDNFYHSFGEPFEVEYGKATPENLKKIFVLGIQARGGPKLSEDECRVVLNAFDNAIKEILGLTDKGKEKVQKITERIMGIPKIGPKITGVFWRDVVYFYGIWKKLVNYLYQPVDVHIQNILVNKLKVLDNREVPYGDRFTTHKNQKFQDLLSQAHTPRIESDYLWYIGYHFCSKRVPLACELCYIKKYCKDPIMYNGKMGSGL